MNRVIVKNTGRIAMMMAAAMAMTDHFKRTSQLRAIAGLVKASPVPHHPTGIAKARRAAVKRNNIRKH